MASVKFVSLGYHSRSGIASIKLHKKPNLTLEKPVKMKKRCINIRIYLYRRENMQNGAGVSGENTGGEGMKKRTLQNNVRIFSKDRN